MIRYLFILLFTGLVGLPNAWAEEREAVFAGGCFWCMEPPYDKLDGVLETTSGYTGGHTKNPSYRSVTGGDTGHYEAVRVTYDPEKIDYAQLLEVFWHNIDPLDAGGQFCDRGSSYRTAIFVRDETQKHLARESKARIAEQRGQSVATRIRSAGPFYPAEDYHQNYYQKNPLRYQYYRHRCGRDQRLEELWGSTKD